MKFTFIKEVSEPVMYYGQMVSTGDVIELNDHFSAKAKRTQDFVIYREPDEAEANPAETPVIKKKRGRKAD